jgi:hypothetical protein
MGEGYLHRIREDVRELNLKLSEAGIRNELPLEKLVLVASEITGDIGKWCVAGVSCLRPGVGANGTGVRVWIGEEDLRH